MCPQKDARSSTARSESTSKVVQVPSVGGDGRFRHSGVEIAGDTVRRTVGPSADSVHLVLRFLEERGFQHAPRFLGWTDDGREILTFVEGEVPHPGLVSAEATHRLGEILAGLHALTSEFDFDGRKWTHCPVRATGVGRRIVLGHGDASPWNIVTCEGIPIALIDWDNAGPVDQMLEVAQAAWLAANLYSDDIPEAELLPSLGERAAQLAAFADGYGLSRAMRAQLVDRIIEVCVRLMATACDEACVTSETKQSDALWQLAWSARSGNWILQNRSTLETALRS